MGRLGQGHRHHRGLLYRSHGASGPLHGLPAEASSHASCMQQQTLAWPYHELAFHACPQHIVRLIPCCAQGLLFIAKFGDRVRLRWGTVPHMYLPRLTCDLATPAERATRPHGLLNSLCLMKDPRRRKHLQLIDESPRIVAQWLQQDAVELLIEDASGAAAEQLPVIEGAHISICRVVAPTSAPRQRSCVAQLAASRPCVLAQRRCAPQLQAAPTVVQSSASRAIRRTTRPRYVSARA